MTRRKGPGPRRRLAAVLVGVVSLAGCGGQGGSPNTSAHTTAVSPAASTSTSAPVGTAPAAGSSAGDAGAVTDVSTYATWNDPRITESSALTRVGDHLITANDRGDPAVLFVSTGTLGTVTGTLTYAADDPVDVEALASSPDGTIWVGDVGDNNRVRSTVAIYRIDPVGAWDGDQVVPATRFEFTYPDGAHDAEALLVQPKTGELFIVTKDTAGGAVYAVPTLDASRAVVLEKVASVTATVTDGVFTADAAHVLLRTYKTMTAYAYPGFDAVAKAALPAQPKGEGLTLGQAEGTYLISTEGVNTPVLQMRWES